MDYWSGDIPVNSIDLIRATDIKSPGWGMSYLVGVIYAIFGRNFLAAQSFVAVVGAATAPLVFLCSDTIYKNRRVARYAAIGIAIFPSFIIWSGQLLKDGLIVFLLVLVMLMVMRLQEKFSYLSILVLVFSLGGIISLRFYIFYMLAVAVAGSFVLGTSTNMQSTLRRIAILVVSGVALTYLGVLRTASSDLTEYTNLDRIQNSRLDLATSADSGFGGDIDVSTPIGAISAIPVGFVYLMLAPFPWQIGSLRQSITLPEVLVWWAMLPLLGWGLWYTVRHRLRAAFPILIFTLMLTLAYSILSGQRGHGIPAAHADTSVFFLCLSLSVSFY